MFFTPFTNKAGLTLMPAAFSTCATPIFRTFVHMHNCIHLKKMGIYSCMSGEVEIKLFLKGTEQQKAEGSGGKFMHYLLFLGGFIIIFLAFSPQFAHPPCSSPVSYNNYQLRRVKVITWSQPAASRPKGSIRENCYDWLVSL